MKILAIESSCDETACAIVEDGRKVLANTVASQIDIHAKTGGVVPEVAAREHVLNIIPVLDDCLQEAGLDWDDIDAVAVTRGPGLLSSLIIGTQTANVISYVKGKPLIPVQHIVGHIYSNWLEREEEIEFPVMILTVSGGHNELVLMRGHNNFKVLGETRDDAAGEAFDKVARILGLGYPGGPAISKLALEGDATAFSLPRSYLEKGSLDFSFSGLKTACLTVVKEHAEGGISEKFKADLAASFQEAVCEVLSDKLMMAAAKYPEVKEIHLAGGVSANGRLREMIEAKAGGQIFRYPTAMKFCTDNAAMIGAAAYYLYQLEPLNYRSCSNIVPTTEFEI
ncbi:tRNA (adenosine(37)-N6)-threonylcarbamoyltransferase complex transferase subunit TsaD [Patescibacteria group bacterium]|nr:tRNA (adenosine(37)-N6)-threonylcarbamoyltransferase complex transferase subunit TsaD [Patescibacteria group bacterium]